MIYNTGHRFTKMLSHVSQENIYRCPEYFAMSKEEVKRHPSCPEFLKNTIDEFPWSDRPSVLQIRPQDFRRGKPDLLGDHWHIDCNVRLKDGKDRIAKDLDDWRLLVVSFGGIVETEFIQTPLDLPDLNDPKISHMDFFQEVHRRQFTIEKPLPNQLGEYTSKDIHRMGTQYKTGCLRLMIVAFESSTVIGDGWVLPSICEKQNPSADHPKFKDYIL